MSDRLQRLIHLINKTGDKLIVFDQEQPDNCYVISNLRDYEQMVKDGGSVKGLTEDELIDKINRDIAVWKSDQRENLDFANFSQEFEGSEEVGTDPEPKPWTPPKPMNPNNTSSPDPKNIWKIPESRRREAEFTI